MNIATSALSHWDSEFGLAAAQLRTREFSADGTVIVREQGRVPGVRVAFGKQVGQLRYFVRSDFFDGGIVYRGQTQGGVPQSAHTHVRLIRTELGVQASLSPIVHIFSSIERDRWIRDIQAQGSSVGLSEDYRSWRLLLGVGTHLYSNSWLNLNGSTALVVARAEDIHVRFGERVFDDANLHSKPAIGARMGLVLSHRAYPRLSFGAELDWLRVSVGDSVPLLRNARVVGTVRQPEHQRLQLLGKLSYTF